MNEGLLVTLVESHANLYDKSRSDFKNVNKRDNSWDDIAAAMGESKENCQRVWLNIRTRYTKEKKRRTSMPSGSAGDEQLNWSLYHTLHFLDEHVKQRRTSTNVNYSVSSASVSASSQVPSSSRSSSSNSGSCWDTVRELISSPSPCSPSEGDEEVAKNTTAVLPNVTANTFRKRKGGATEIADFQKKILNTADALQNFIREQPTEDSDVAFAKYVALSLKELDQKNKSNVKLEIMQILYKYNL